MTRIAAFDLGTQCGWAVYDGETLLHGSTDLSIRTREHQGSRWLRARRLFAETFDLLDERTGIDCVYFEQVKNHGKNSSYTAHAYGGFKASLELSCLARGELPMIGFEPAKIKKHWTGKGNADKRMMLAEAQRRGFAPCDDNAADAIAIIHSALEILRVAPIVPSVASIEDADDDPFPTLKRKSK